MELTFIQSNLGPDQIVEAEGKKYIMDTSTMVGKQYYWGFLPKEITVEMIEISTKDTSFEIKSKMNVGITTVALIMLPFSKLRSNVLENTFNTYGVSQNIGLKLFLFLLSMVAAFIVNIIFMKNAREKAKKRLTNGGQRFILTFSNNGKRMPVVEFLLMFNLVCLLFYFGIHNGSESVLLIINGFISYFVFLAFLGNSMIGKSYKDKQLIFEKIEKINEIGKRE